MNTYELILNYVASVHSVGVVLTYQGPNTKIHKGNFILQLVTLHVAKDINE